MRKPKPGNGGAALGRLLGSPWEDVGCEECFERLDEFVELELAGADVADRLPGVRAHLDGCRACREEYESLRALLLADAAAGRVDRRS
jgi:hypothetical protein